MHDCPFCPSNPSLTDEVLARNAHCLLIRSHDPVLVSSVMTIPVRHVATPFELIPEEWMATHELLVEAKRLLDRERPHGYAISWNVHTVCVDPARFQPVAPYEADPSRWHNLPWIDRYSGNRYRVGSAGDRDDPKVMQLQTYRDVVREFRTHPEAKSADVEGMGCGRRTVGLLQRRAVQESYVAHVGKEANKLEEVEAGLEHDPEIIYTEYRDPARDPWRSIVLPVLKQIPANQLAEATGLAVSTVKAARNGHTAPQGGNRQALVHAAVTFARERLRALDIPAPAEDLACCAAYLASMTSQ